MTISCRKKNGAGQDSEPAGPHGLARGPRGPAHKPT